MDPATLILKKTIPADLAETKKAINSVAKNPFKQDPIQFLPFEAIEEVGDDDEDEGPFLLCTYNQTEKGSYRSPYTNRTFSVKKNKKGGNEVESISKAKFVPEDEKDMRKIELAANEVWSAYVQLYYGSEGVGSAFLKSRSTKAKSFEGIFGVHKGSKGKGAWDCVHLVQVEEPKEKKCSYRVDSAVVMSICPYKGTTISSSLSKETAKTLKVRSSNITGSHWENIGQIMEEVEIEFRSRLERVDIPKSIEIMDSAYTTNRDSITAAMITGIDESEEPMMATGMGVGSALIGEIADKAKQKKAEGNAFLDRMKGQQDAKDAQMREINDSGNDNYTDMKKGLKKAPASPMVTEGVKSLKINQDKAGPGYTDLKAGLKKSALSPKSSPKAPISPASPEWVGKAGLKKAKITTKQQLLPPLSPTPEFLDFRNKLKKAGPK